MDDIDRRFNPDRNGAGANACLLALLPRHATVQEACDRTVRRQLRASLQAVFFRPRNPEEKSPQTFPIV